MAGAPPTVAQELHLQARLEQVEAELATAHEQFDRMAPRPDTPAAEGQADTPGVAGSAARCTISLGSLTARIRELADATGRLI